jgi:uncharacterized membrane protein
MNKGSIALSSILAGAGLVYILDPQAGGRRRARLHDRAARAASRARDGLHCAVRDLQNREHGLAARAIASVRSGRAPDAIVQARARAALGRLTKHAGAIETLCRGGCLELRGDVLAAEHDRIVRGLERVRGVKEVRDQLAVHGDTTGVAALSGERAYGRSPVRVRVACSPGTRLALAVLGAGLLGAAAFARGLGRAGRLLPGMIGAGFVATSFGTGGLGRGPIPIGAIAVEKTIRISAPVEVVYEIFSRPEEFPRFMCHVRAVDKLSEGRFRWTIEGPAGVPVTWTAELVEHTPNRRLAWRSVEPTLVRNEGTIELVPESSEVTRVHVRMTYTPPGGIVGHAIAAIFGADPKHALDDDLLRMASLLEQGTTTGRAGRVRAEDLS